MDWAGKNGTNTRELASCIMESRKHPEQGFRACLGIMRLVKRYSPERVEAACGRALHLKAYSYKSVESILKNNLDSQPVESPADQSHPIVHYNIRGREYYRDKEDAHA
jgi:transposase